MPLDKKTTHHLSKGLSMIEVLVAVLVLAIGILGISALQITGLKNNHSAQLRTEASIHAYAMLDRMRVNKTAADSGEYDIAIADAAPSGTTLTDTDRTEWLTSLASALPSGDGAISTSNGEITITIQWDDSRGLAGNSTQTFTISSRV